MSNEPLPAPLVPAEVDLRGYEFMPLYGDRLKKSETWVMASPEGKVAALALWWHAYGHEVPAGSLPDNDQLLADYAGYGVALKAWLKIRPQAMRGWLKCSDGRLYHRFVTQLVTEAWKFKNAQRDRTEKARLARLSQKPSQNLLQNEKHPVTRSVTESVTASTGQDRTGQDKKQRRARTQPADNPTDAPAEWVTALLSLGVNASTSHPTFIAWIADGFTWNQVIEAVSVARQRKPLPESIALNYVDRILRDPPKIQEPAWWLDDAKTMAKARELGVSTIGKQREHLIQDVREAIANSKRLSASA